MSSWNTLFLLFSLFSVLHVHAQIPNVPQQPATIGLIADLTGPFASLGSDCQQGFEIARRAFAPNNTVNGRRVEYVHGDSRGEAKSSLSEFNRMVDSKRILAVSVSRTGMAMPINPVSKQRRIPILAAAAHPRFVSDNPYAFREWVRAEDEGRALAMHARARGFKRLGLITTENDYLTPISEGYAERFEHDGGRVVFDHVIDDRFSEFSTLLLQIKSKNPDVIMLNLNIAQLGAAYRKMRELGLTMPAYSSYWVFKKEVIDAAGAEALEGVTSVEMDFHQPKFLDAAQRAFGDTLPTAMTYACYCALAHILRAIENHPEIASPQSMYEELSKIDSVMLLDGPIAYRDREVQLPMRYEVLRAGSVELGQLVPPL